MILQFGLLLGPGETIRKEVTRLNDFIGGIDEGVRPRREDSCLQSVQDNLGFLIGRYYVVRVSVFHVNTGLWYRSRCRRSPATRKLTQKRSLKL